METTLEIMLLRDSRYACLICTCQSLNLCIFFVCMEGRRNS